MADIYERFWSKVDIGQPNECWPWLSSINTSGYGSFRIGDKVVGAHRFAYEATGVKLDNHAHHVCKKPEMLQPCTLGRRDKGRKYDDGQWRWCFERSKDALQMGTRIHSGKHSV